MFLSVILRSTIMISSLVMGGLFSFIDAANTIAVPIAHNGTQETIQADGITVAAHLMLSAEYRKKYYSLPGVTQQHQHTDLNKEDIYPVAITIKNENDKAITIFAPTIASKDAEHLTASRLQQAIKAHEYISLFFAFTVVLLPASFYSIYKQQKLESVKPLIQEHGFNEDKISLQPQESVQKTIFVRMLPQKTAANESAAPPFPEKMMVGISYKSASSWF